MIRIRPRAALFALLALAWAALAGAGETPQRSGFLGSAAVYERLQPVALGNGAIAERWFGRQMRTGYYASVLVDDVMFYPEPTPGPRVSASTLREVRSYLGDRLRASIGELLPLADGPAEHVLRLQTAITGVNAGKDAAASHGVAALFGSGERAVARVFVEVRFHDARTGELVGLGVREVDGEPLAAGVQAVQLQQVRASLDRAAQDAAATLAMTLTARPGGS
jgi:hypothetical protein